MTHEMPVPVMKAMFKEAHRLLAPNGIMIHDGGLAAPEDSFALLMLSWFGTNANEPFSFGYRGLDFAKAYAEAGFAQDKIFQVQREPVYLKGQLPPVSLMGAIKD